MRTLDIDTVIAKKEAAKARLEEELTVLRRARALMNRADSTGDESEADRKPVEAKRRPAGGRWRRRRVIKHPHTGLLIPDSDVGRAKAALEKAGNPLHVKALLDLIEKETGDRPKRLSLVGSLARYSKLGRHFFRAAPNTFGLLEWRGRPAA